MQQCSLENCNVFFRGSCPLKHPQRPRRTPMLSKLHPPNPQKHLPQLPFQACRAVINFHQLPKNSCRLNYHASQASLLSDGEGSPTSLPDVFRTRLSQSAKPSMRPLAPVTGPAPARHLQRINIQSGKPYLLVASMERLI